MGTGAQGWWYLAREKDYMCAMCFQYIPYGEREVYFSRGICGWCANRIDKDGLPAPKCSTVKGER